MEDEGKWIVNLETNDLTLMMSKWLENRKIEVYQVNIYIFVGEIHRIFFERIS